MSLPAQVAIMSLQSTPTNADEANMVLEDFAQLKEKEIQTIWRFGVCLYSKFVIWI
jgi:hypothetical protein